MAIKKSQLYTKLWQACDELRGGMDASQYKDYVLVVLFIKYISDRAKNGDADLYIDLQEGCTFDDLVALKGKTDIGEKMNVILSRIGEANEQLADTITNADFADEQKLGKGKDLVETVSNLIGVFQDKDLDLSNNRAADDDLVQKLVKDYATMNEQAIRHYVVESKWGDALWARFQGELAHVKTQIVADVKALAGRYSDTLPDLESEVESLSAKVARHLAAMGVAE